MLHLPVLLHETITGLALKKGAVVLDATLGLAGHGRAICEKIGPAGIFIGLDADRYALTESLKLLAPCPAEKILIRGNFRELKARLAKKGVRQVDAVLLDLGMSSYQLDYSGRGFSFNQFAEPLLMTFKEKPSAADLTARHVVNDWREENIANVLYGYSEERYARRIARAIVTARQTKPVETVGELVAIINQTVPSRYHQGRIHPATRAFQALRIVVNDELKSLTLALSDSFDILQPDGRLAVISFHSLEVRIVKKFFKAKQLIGAGELITKKPIKAAASELKTNPKARSAELRIIKKT